MADLKAFLCGELPNHENMLQNEQLRDLLERRGIVEDPDIPNAKARLAEQELRRNEIIALEYLQDFVQAREKMTSYLADYPDDEAAAREYEFLQSR